METTQCLPNRNEIVVVGNKNGRRAEWFGKAADQLHIPVRYIEWHQVRGQKLAPSVFVKLDPPDGPGSNLSDLSSYMDWYRGELSALHGLPKVSFLNSPSAILQTLDKLACKKRLMEDQIPVTDLVETSATGYDQLLADLERKRMRDVFIKPRYGAGAAGIMAYRYHPATGQQVLYTCARRGEKDELINTKTISRITGPEEITFMINRLLLQPVIVERWIPKATCGGMGFDLRLVYQFGQVDAMVARGSKAPLTNLHLNNCVLPIDALGFEKGVIKDLEGLCQRAVSAIDGLQVAGLDVLITPGGRIKVIEINGQGDLIYQDIFAHNRIYRRQIQEGVKYYGAKE